MVLKIFVIHNLPSIDGTHSRISGHLCFVFQLVNYLCAMHLSLLGPMKNRHGCVRVFIRITIVSDGYHHFHSGITKYPRYTNECNVMLLQTYNFNVLCIFKPI